MVWTKVTVTQCDISVAQTAEGAMDEITSMLQRMHWHNNRRMDQITLMIVRPCSRNMIRCPQKLTVLPKDTTFGGQKLLDGSYSGSFQVGADAAQTISFKMTNAFSLAVLLLQQLLVLNLVANTDTSSAEKYIVSTTTTAGVTFANIQDISGSTGSSAQLALANLDYLIKAVDSKRSELGAVQNRFDSTIRNQSNISENVSAAKKFRIRDADFATETANMTKQNILQQASSTILAQANQRPQTALSLLQGG